MSRRHKMQINGERVFVTIHQAKILEDLEKAKGIFKLPDRLMPHESNLWLSLKSKGFIELGKIMTMDDQKDTLPALRTPKPARLGARILPLGLQILQEFRDLEQKEKPREKG